MSKPSTVIKQHLKARTEKNLERKMLINNIKYNISFDYTDIQKVGKSWFAWFEIDIKNALLLKTLKMVKE